LIYLDASALVTLVGGRRFASELREFLSGYPGMPMGTSSIGFVEVIRTLDRIGDYPHAMRDLVQNLTEILVTEEVRDQAALVPTGVRTLGAVHVASAQVIGSSLKVLVSYDTRMLDVAHSLGLPTAAPGLAEGV